VSHILPIAYPSAILARPIAIPPNTHDPSEHSPADSFFYLFIHLALLSSRSTLFLARSTWGRPDLGKPLSHDPVRRASSSSDRTHNLIFKRLVSHDSFSRTRNLVFGSPFSIVNCRLSDSVHFNHQSSTISPHVTSLKLNRSARSSNQPQPNHHPPPQTHPPTHP
jgi:hypothetical protein